MQSKKAAPKKVPSSMSGVPVGAKIISVLYYIGAVASVIVGILLLVGAGFIGSYVEDLSVPGVAMLGTAMFIVGGIILIALAVLEFFVGRGLWKGRNWARIVAIVLAILGIISAILSIIQASYGSIVSLIIHAIIGGYLLFSKNVKSAFA